MSSRARDPYIAPRPRSTSSARREHYFRIYSIDCLASLSQCRHCRGWFHRLAFEPNWPARTLPATTLSAKVTRSERSANGEIAADDRIPGGNGACFDGDRPIVLEDEDRRTNYSPIYSEEPVVVLSLDAPTTSSFVPEVVVGVPTLTLFDASLPIAPEPLGGFCDGPLNANVLNANRKTIPAIKTPAMTVRIFGIVWNGFFFIWERYCETADGEEDADGAVGFAGTCAAAALCCCAVTAAGSAISCATLLVALRRVQKMIWFELKYTSFDGPHATWPNGYTPMVALPLASVLRWRNHASSMCGVGNQSSLPK